MEKRGWICDDTYDKMKAKLDKSRAILEEISKIGVKMDQLKSRTSQKNWRSWNLNAEYEQRKTEISAYRVDLPSIEGNLQLAVGFSLVRFCWSYPQ